MFDDNQDNQNQTSDQLTGGGSTSKILTPPEPSPNGTLDAGQTTPASPSGLPGNLTSPEPPADMSAAPAPATTAPVASPSGSSTPVADDDLLTIKQDALQQLSPLVDHLDQSPEERFRTTMMMIQATDDSSKIKEAYDAAQAIKDDKARAQALLDVVNEINYFTQHQDQDEEATDKQ